MHHGSFVQNPQKARVRHALQQEADICETHGCDDLTALDHRGGLLPLLAGEGA